MSTSHLHIEILSSLNACECYALCQNYYASTRAIVVPGKHYMHSVCAWLCVPLCVCRSENNCVVTSLSFDIYMGSGD